MNLKRRGKSSDCNKWVPFQNDGKFYWKNYENGIDLIIHDHHSIKSHGVINLSKLTSSKIYSRMLSKVQNKPSSNLFFKDLFDDSATNWAVIYMTPIEVMYNTLNTKSYTMPYIWR